MSETLRTNIVVHDGMTPAMKGMLSSLRLVITSFEDVQRVSGNAIDTRSINAAKNELSKVEANFIRMENEINQAANAQNRFNSSIRQGESHANNLGSKIMSYVGAYAGMQGIGKVVGTSDKVVQITARLNMMPGDNVTELQDKIFQSAQRARALYVDTADVVAKLGVRAGHVFDNNDETIAFAENLNKMFVIGGASQQEMASTALQLTQALGSGVLRGEELNAVLEASPDIGRIIEEYLDAPKGSLREMASEGEITAGIVKNALLGATEEINETFEKMPMTWGQVWTGTINEILYISMPLLKFINLLAQNWSILRPIVLGVVTALTMYLVAMAAINTISAINVGLQTAQAIAIAAHLGATVADIAAVHGLTVAQWALNGALLANPIFWVVAGIILMISVLYAGVAAYNSLTGSAVSATGIIAGAFFILGGFIGNLFMGIMEIIYGVINAGVNGFIAFGNFLGNVFVNPVGAVVKLFADMGDNILGIISKIAKAIDFVTGSNLESAVNNLRGGLMAKVDNFVGDNYKEFFSPIDLSLDSLGLDRFNYGELWDKGYDWGSNLSFFPDMPDMPDIAFDPDLGKGIKDDTGKIKKSLEKSEDELKALRDLATIRAINRFSFDGINVNVSQKFGDVHQAMDLDGIGNIVISQIETVLDEFVSTSTEGVYDV